MLQTRLRSLLIVAVALTFLITPLAVGSASSPRAEHLGASPAQLIVRAVHVEGGSPWKIPAPQALLRGNAPQASQFIVTYNGTWDSQAKAAFEYAKSIWERQISSPVPIRIIASWKDLGAGVLGSSGPSDFWRNFAGAPNTGTWYVNALANKLVGYDLDVDEPDIEINFANGYYSFFYFGLDANPPANKHDFVTVVMHEIAHGLGFVGSMTYSGGVGGWGLGTNSPFVYDLYTLNGYGQALLNTNLFPNGSSQLGEQLTSGNVFFNGSHAVSANNGISPKLYAPSYWDRGSSYSHLDESTYPAGNANALMTPAVANGEAIHSIGPITLGIMKDIGWTIEQNFTDKMYIPNAYRYYSPSTSSLKGIYGRVTKNGESAIGVPLSLRFYNGSAWSTLAETTSSESGFYSFPDAPSLGANQRYYVRFINNASTPMAGCLWFWGTKTIMTYYQGGGINIGTFDIADIALESPASGWAGALPVQFNWIPRPSTTTDSYEFDLYDANNSSGPSWYTNPPLGYVSSYRLSTLPANFEFNVPYVWEVWVYAPDGSYGVSYQINRITFAATGSGAAQPLLDQAPQSGRSVEDYEPKRLPDNPE